MGQYQSHGGRAPRAGEQCSACLGTITGELVELHCGHSFCLRPCFEKLVDFDHTLCPMCRTPIVITAPQPSYVKLKLLTLTKKPTNETNFMRYDRLFQYKLIHDGDRRPEILKCNGGVDDEIFETMRSACRCCRYAPNFLQVDERDSTPFLT
mmetsp:Transcript_135887/g.253902  ORF Transcript_135887/g.253902 Transcript_135887/m.253902 type:complete len:152 (-) Transcript_135887:26-481(-)